MKSFRNANCFPEHVDFGALLTWLHQKLSLAVLSLVCPKANVTPQRACTAIRRLTGVKEAKGPHLIRQGPVHSKPLPTSEVPNFQPYPFRKRKLQNSFFLQKRMDGRHSIISIGSTCSNMLNGEVESVGSLQQASNKFQGLKC